MATEVQTQDGQVVAVRSWGGSSVGVVVQMEVTQSEWVAWSQVQVAEEASDRWQTFEQWVSEQRATVRWDNAARQNEAARSMEDHRWAQQDDTDVSCMFRQAAAVMRQRARDCARQQMQAA